MISGNMISSFLHPEDAYEDAQNEARRYWDESKGYLKPFMDRGLEQYPQLQEFIKKLSNPMALQNEWSSGYETSPYAKRMMDINKQIGLENASSMGLMGSSAALNNLNRGASDIVQKDRQQFLNDLMQKYMSAIGLSSNIYGTGAASGSSLSNLGQQMGSNMAGLEYGKSAAPGVLFGKLLGTGLNMAFPGMGGFGGFPGMGGFGGF
jgi:hypothetical protein